MVLAPLCCGHQVNRISGLQVTLGQFNGNTAAWACTVARVRNGSGILGFHFYFFFPVLIQAWVAEIYPLAIC